MVETFRQITASEAAYLIQGYPLAGNSHSVSDRSKKFKSYKFKVINLSVHEENHMPVFYREGELVQMEARVFTNHHFDYSNLIVLIGPGWNIYEHAHGMVQTKRRGT